MTQMVSPPSAPAGLTQHDLVRFGAQLGIQGSDEEIIAKVTDKLIQIANEAAFKGAAEMALTVQQVRAEEQAKWQEYTALILQQVLYAIAQTKGFWGYVDKTAVEALLQAAINKQRTRKPTAVTAVEGK
jgi:uncharacterized protein YihD (DUF1040 family)